MESPNDGGRAEVIQEFVEEAIRSHAAGDNPPFLSKQDIPAASEDTRIPPEDVRMFERYLRGRDAGVSAEEIARYLRFSRGKQCNLAIVDEGIFVPFDMVSLDLERSDVLPLEFERTNQHLTERMLGSISDIAQEFIDKHDQGARNPFPTDMNTKMPMTFTRTCQVCSKPGTLRCGACKTIRYCSAECQKKDWKTHKQVCKTLITPP